MTRDEYIPIDALNFSSAKYILRSPAHFRSHILDEEPEDDTKYLVGRLVHAMVLEKKDFQDLYAIKPEGLNLATREGRAWKAAQTLPILREEDANRIPKMAKAITDHPLALRALEVCPEREKCLVGEYHGVKLKALIDACSAKTICDIKTTTDARETAFSARAIDLDYDMQAAWYRTLAGGNHVGFAWIVVETAAPFAVSVFCPSAEMEVSGELKMQAAVDRYKESRKREDWSAHLFGDYSLDIQELAPPKWRIMQLENAGQL